MPRSTTRTPQTPEMIGTWGNFTSHRGPSTGREHRRGHHQRPSKRELEYEEMMQRQSSGQEKSS